MNNTSPITKLKNNLENIIEKTSVKDDNSYEAVIEKEIEKLESLYNEIKDFIVLLKNHKASIKSISDLYANLISLSKNITDLKEKKAKNSENDIKLIKSAFEIVQKMELLSAALNKDGTASIDITEFLKNMT